MPFEGTGNDQVSATGAVPAMQENGSQHLGGTETPTKVNLVGWSKRIVYRESQVTQIWSFSPLNSGGSYLVPRRIFLQLKLPESFSFDQMSNIFMREFWFLEVQPTNENLQCPVLCQIAAKQKSFLLNMPKHFKGFKNIFKVFFLTW